MTLSRRTVAGLVVGLGALSLGLTAAVGSGGPRPEVSGSLWVANRDKNTIRSFDARTGAVLATVPMRADSQPGDLAAAMGKLYVAEEFGTPKPAVAVVDATSGEVVKRIDTGPRPHHVHASPGGNLVAYGVFGTNRIGIIDTSSDSLVREWETSTNPLARAHAGEFSPDGRTVYVANDIVGELSAVDALSGELLWPSPMAVPGVHEIAVLNDGRTAYVSARSANAVHIVDLELRTIEHTIGLPAPDTLRLSPDERMLTVGLRGAPARVAIVDTVNFEKKIVTIGGAGTIAGHQWTAPTGRYTFAAFEGPGAGIAVIDHALDNAVVDILAYPGKPHGVAFVRP